MNLVINHLSSAFRNKLKESGTRETFNFKVLAGPIDVTFNFKWWYERFAEISFVVDGSDRERTFIRGHHSAMLLAFRVDNSECAFPGVERPATDNPALGRKRYAVCPWV